MRKHFDSLVKHIESALPGGIQFIASFAGENSDFVRFNHGRVRQAGSVEQGSMSIRLIAGRRHTAASFSISGDDSADSARLKTTISRLLEVLPQLPEDPYLLVSENVQSTEQVADNRLPNTEDVLSEVVSASSGNEPLDFVGIYAAGEIFEGLANSHGQRNWFQTSTYNLDWCLYQSADKAVKNNLAGTTWDEAAFADKIRSGRRQLEILKRDSRIVKPGQYRVYLAPAALAEIVSMMSWGGFSYRCVENRTTPLLKLVDGELPMSPKLNVSEVPGAGLAPCFQGDGFVRPDHVPLIQSGRHAGSLISPRTAMENDLETNGATDGEQPIALEISPGSLPNGKILDSLGTGLWVSNLWYLNFSDRASGRITGMTRFATYWVENGEVVAPVSVMRFDDTFFNILGTNLVDLTNEAELQLSADTYYARSTSSARIPGALVDGFALTL